MKPSFFSLLPRTVIRSLKPSVCGTAWLTLLGLPIAAEVAVVADADAQPAVEQKALESLHVAAPLKVELVAAEPWVFSPIALSFDKSGAIWVVEYAGDLGASSEQRRAQPQGRIVKLVDEDKDGVIDKRVVFLDKLASPTTVFPFHDGVLVGDPPYLRFWKDLDGDEKAEVQETLAEDFVNAAEPDAPLLKQPNHLTWARDNAFEAAGYGRRFKWQGGKWVSSETEARGAWGAAQDDAGRWYYQTQEGALAVDFLPAVLVKQGEAATALGVPLLKSTQVWVRSEKGEFEAKEFGAMTAPYVYRGAFLPLDFYGNVFVSDPSLNLVRRHRLIFDRDRIQAENAYKKQEFLNSSDPQFHPLGFGTSFDGSLYIADWHGETLSSLSEGKTQGQAGRIYRVVPKDRKSMDPYWPQTDREWIGYLGHANATLRTLAQQTLVLSSDETLDEDLRVAVQSQENLIRRLYAMWTLEGRGVLKVKDLQPLCYDVDFKIRSAAVSLLGQHAVEGAKEREEALKLLLKLPAESSGDTLNRRMLALGKYHEPSALAGKVKLLVAKPKEPRLLESFFTYEDRALDLGLLVEVIDGKTSFQRQRALQQQLIQKLSERIWQARDAGVLEAWMKLLVRIGDPTQKKAHRPQASQNMLSIFESWLQSQPEPLTLASCPEGWASWLLQQKESTQDLIKTLVKFSEAALPIPSEEKR